MRVAVKITPTREMTNPTVDAITSQPRSRQRRESVLHTDNR